MQSLFERVVKATGLANIIATGVVKRACFRAGIKQPERLSRIELQAVMPGIETMLALYLSAEQVAEKMFIIGQMSRALSGPYEFRLEDPALDD